MAPARIQVVDDDDAVRGVVFQFLSQRGHEISAADGGENGLNIFLKNNFEIVLAHDEMPGMDSVGLARRIQHHSPGKEKRS